MDNDSSILSERESPQRPHKLEDQLDGLSPTDWKNDSFDLNISNASLQLSNPNSSKKQILSPSKESQYQHESELSKSQTSIKSVEKHQKQQQGQRENSIPTINIAGDTILNSQTGGSSTLSSHGQGSNFKQYLFVNQQTYQPHIKNLLQLYLHIKEFSEKSQQNLRMYYLFFKNKLSQELAYYDDKKQQQKIQNNQVYNEVFVNAKLALNALSDSKKGEIERGKKFIEVLQFCYQSVRNLFKQMTINKKDQQRQFEELHRKIGLINGQIECILTCRVQRQGSYHKDRYLQSKYVIEKQKQYINCIYQLNRKLVKYINSCLNEQQFQVWTATKASLNHYYKGYQQCYPGDKKFQSSAQKLLLLQNESSLMQQMAQLLETCVMQTFKLHIGEHCQEAKHKLDRILITLNKEFQETIYFSILQIQDGLILYKSGAKWTPVNATKAVLVDLVVSVDGYLHLEKQKDSVVLKLKDLKISQKGNQIVLVNKSGGVMEFIMKRPQLGKLQFEQKGELQTFVKILLTFLKKL